MKPRDLLRLSVQSLLRTKARAVLTMLGIVIGIASVILMLAVGTAAETFLLSQVASFGSDLVMVTNGRGDVRHGEPSQTVKQTLTYADYRDLKQQSWVRAANANSISTDVYTFGSASVFGSVVGSTPDEIAVFNSVLAEGRFLQSDDLDSHARVIVLGAGIAQDLFGQQDPIGQQVRIAKRNFRVIGVMAHGGTRFFSELDTQSYIPVTAAMDLYNKDRLDFISFKSEGLSIDEGMRRVRDLFRDNHKISNAANDLAKDDFRVLTQADAIKNAGVIGMILQILLVSIAAISLIVAGIGIMNIMFVTVTERTSEIGLRKAIGAKPKDILSQFLTEALLLTFGGGLIGVVLGVSSSYAMLRVIGSYQEGWTFQFPTQGIVLAFSVSAFIGVIFGYFPARRAARLNPIEALRYE